MMKYRLGKILLVSLAIILFAGLAYGQSKLSIHGYLTQAFGITNKHQLFGIPEKGTSDYRNLALQFRYDIDEINSLIFQFSHKRLGLSPSMVVEEDIKLDWGFYEYRFKTTTAFRIGRVPIPLGIFNELRDVGVVLPFYRVPFTFYQEGNYMSETVDGLEISHALAPDSPWSLDIHLYGGEWKWTEAVKDPMTQEDLVASIRVDRGIGGQLWLNAPLDGLRFGFGGHRAHVGTGVRINERNFHSWNVSIEADLNRYTARAEYRGIRFHDSIDLNAYYAQAGIKLTEKLHANVQAEFSDLKNVTVPSFFGGGTIDVEVHKDYAIGINYAFLYNVVLKSEVHWSKTYDIQDRLVNIFTEEPAKVIYALLSLSASF